jgi:hypothetical protein
VRRDLIDIARRRCLNAWSHYLTTPFRPRWSRASENIRSGAGASAARRSRRASAPASGPTEEAESRRERAGVASRRSVSRSQKIKRFRAGCARLAPDFSTSPRPACGVGLSRHEPMDCPRSPGVGDAPSGSGALAGRRRASQVALRSRGPRPAHLELERLGSVGPARKLLTACYT